MLAILNLICALCTLSLAKSISIDSDDRPSQPALRVAKVREGNDVRTLWGALLLNESFIPDIDH